MSKVYVVIWSCELQLSADVFSKRKDAQQRYSEILENEYDGQVGNAHHMGDDVELVEEEIHTEEMAAN